MPKSPKLFVAVLALAIAVSLALGVSGGAQAGALTKGAVKKIAVKVVKKRAGSLSVAHAATATNASALAGRPPSAYSDETIRYPLVSNTLSTSKSFALVGLAPGAHYYVHYHLILGNSPGTPAGNCVLLVPGSTSQLGWSYGTVFANAVSLDAGAVVTVPSTGNVSISCSFAATVNSFANQMSFAEATPLDTVTNATATATPARPAGRSVGSGTAPRP